MKKEWIGKKVLILGLGQYPKGSGISAALYAVRQGAEVRVTDLKTEKELEANVKRLKKFKNVSFILGVHREEDIRWADIIVRNPRVRPSSPEMQLATSLGKQLESDVSLFLARCPAPVVGITGTRGKSTTTTLVYEILKADKKRRVWLGGNILISPLTYIEQVKKDDIVVLELSSWLLETTGLVGQSPSIACITNLMRDHLNSYDGMEAYGEAKAQIFRHQGPDGVVVLNGDDAFCRQCAKEAPGTVLQFSKKKSKASSAWLTSNALVLKEKDREVELVKRDKLKVYGEHNELNMLAASLVARSAGASIQAIKKTLAAFEGLHDRQERLATIRGITYVNDTTATTPDGVIAAVKALAPRFKRLHFILGGNDKELEFTELGPVMKKAKVNVAMLPGDASKKMADVLASSGVRFVPVSDLKQAVILLSEQAVTGDAVVLSPGATSFGQFKNEFDRGDQFRAFVKQLDKKSKKT